MEEEESTDEEERVERRQLAEEEERRQRKSKDWRDLLTELCLCIAASCSTSGEGSSAGSSNTAFLANYPAGEGLGRRPLHLVCGIHDKTDAAFAAGCLIDKTNADPTLPDARGVSPLCLACGGEYDHSGNLTRVKTPMFEVAERFLASAHIREHARHTKGPLPAPGGPGSGSAPGERVVSETPAERGLRLSLERHRLSEVRKALLVAEEYSCGECKNCDRNGPAPENCPYDGRCADCQGLLEALARPLSSTVKVNCHVNLTF